MEDDVAVIIPCYNEEATIENVIQDYQKYFNDIYVIDNNSSDRTIEIAVLNDVNVIYCVPQGKGAAIRKGFEELNYDYIIMVDGDSTYSAEDSYKLYTYIKENPEYDEVVGNRLNSDYFHHNQRFTRFGNKLFSRIASRKLHTEIKDLLSGSRVLKKSFYKHVLIKHNGFEVETELTLQANSYYIDINYFARPENSHSSLHAIRDGFKIFKVLLFSRVRRDKK